MESHWVYSMYKRSDQLHEVLGFQKSLIFLRLYVNMPNLLSSLNSVILTIFFFSILFFKLPGCLGKACCGHQDTYPVVIRTAELTQLCFHHTERLFSLCKIASTWYMISCLIHLSFIPANTYNCLHSANSLPWRTSNTERYSSLNQSWLTVLGAFSFNVLCITY